MTHLRIWKDNMTTEDNMPRPLSMRVHPFKVDDDTGIVGYVLLVLTPSFELIDKLGEDDWDCDEENPGVFWTGDREVALSLLDAEDWDAAPKVPSNWGEPRFLIYRPKGMSDEDYEVWADEETTRLVDEEQPT
jgi:hypothetical protein